MSHNLSSRREFLSVCTRIGVSSSFFAGALCAMASQEPDPTITPELIDQAAVLAGITIEPAQKEQLIAKLKDQLKSIKAIRDLGLTNDVPPAFRFDPLLPGYDRPQTETEPQRTVLQASQPPNLSLSGLPNNLESLAYRSVVELGELIRTRKVSSVDLTNMYLNRLQRFNDQLKFAVTLTTDRALAQAREADNDLAKGTYRSPLHGIPWGAKDLLAVKGYPTTWGAGGFEHQQFTEDAIVVQRLDSAGAVLVAKLTLGALAMGDKWFGGRTRNPWNVVEGSSGSSAGSAAATASGCVGFAIGSETLGSISSPSTRCGTSGYRPTFGFVPRTGAMTLAWTMDKLGPIARTVEDCALVMQAIYGPDGKDASVNAFGFQWDVGFDWKKLRVGYPAALFEPPKSEDTPPDNLSDEDRAAWETAKPDRAAARERKLYDRQYDLAALQKLRDLGVKLQALELPDMPLDAIALLLNAEAAAAFDDLTRSKRDYLLTEQGPDDWPNLFRAARFYPAIEYLQANRARTLLMRKMAQIFKTIDVLVVPSPADSQLTITNLTGHPAVILPNGTRGQDAPKPPAVDRDDDDRIGGPGTPVSLTFLGNLYRDAALLAFAHHYQIATGFLNQQPPGFGAA
ncbi:MAG: amidase [Verrucomicrobia bacterium]|nr:amidase [Verrucomicrobiota bacterium]